MAAHVPTVVYMNVRHPPAPIRPKPLNILMVSIGAATCMSFAVYTVAAKVMDLMD